MSHNNDANFRVSFRVQGLSFVGEAQRCNVYQALRKTLNGLKNEYRLNFKSS